MEEVKEEQNIINEIQSDSNPTYESKLEAF